MLICVSGSCTIVLDDGENRNEVVLSDPSSGLYVGPNIWHEMKDFSEGAVLLVLASDFYNENDYIRNYDEFMIYIRSIHRAG
jgi:dTDP-4-dehydrorhamnose 3,5-epimerase-like enzyme